MDVNSGAVLYAKSIDDKHYPASITKMMTALVALENSSMDDEVLFSQDSVDILEWDYASIGMTPGEILSMEDAMYGMLLASATRWRMRSRRVSGTNWAADMRLLSRK